MSREYQAVYTANGQLEAHIIKGLLEAAGITVQVSQEGAGEALGFSIGLLGDAYLLVPDDQVAEAEALIAAMEKGDLQQNEAALRSSRLGETDTDQR
jgi:hypothetical protein